MARILIVDDDEILCDLVMELLECDEHMVSAVHHGDDALSAVLASGPELLILDQMLPGPSGLDILAKLRALPQMNDVPVMMLTGSRDAALLVRAAVGGVDDYLAKPFEPAEFMDRARAMLKGAAMARRALA